MASEEGEYYGLYFGFTLGPGYEFASNEALHVEFGGREVRKFQSDGRFTYLVFGGFHSEDAANEFSTRLEIAIMISAFIQRVGIAHRREGGFTEFGLKEMSKNYGSNIVNGGNGATVFREADGTKFATLKVGGWSHDGVIARNDIDNFFKLAKVYFEQINTTYDARRSIRLINLGYLMPDNIGKFLLFMSAIESLTPSVAVEIIPDEKLKEAISGLSRFSTSSAEKEKIRSCIKRINEQSIANSVALVFSKFLQISEDEAKIIYRARSKLVHEGIVPAKQQLAKYVGDCSQLAVILVLDRLGLHR